jgi:ElaB/YqjD/DUF883 family membrane-anchored ribosome-binding protein
LTAHEDTIKAGKRIDAHTPAPALNPQTMPPTATTPDPIPSEPVNSHRPERLGTENENQNDSGNAISTFVSDNPGPALLIGAGLAWLFIDRERSKSQALPTRLKHKALHAKEATGSRLSDAREQTSGRLGDARDYTSERVQSAKERSQERYHSMKRENPLALGAIALAGGLAIGLLLPSTRREDDMMGETRDSLMDQARRIVDEARSAAVATLRSGTENVQEKLMEAKDEAKGAVNESMEDAKEAARDEYRDDDLSDNRN